MNTKKVYTAFNKDGKEILLYRKDANTFIDLLGDDLIKYPKENIDLETLLPINKSLYVFNNMLTNSIKRKYLKDRSKIIDTESIIVGTKGTICKFNKVATDTNYRFYNIPLFDYKYSWDLERLELGLYSFYNKIQVNGHEYYLYKNLFDHKIYYMFDPKYKNMSLHPDFGNGMEFVGNNGYTLKDVIKESFIEKN